MDVRNHMEPDGPIRLRARAKLVMSNRAVLLSLGNRRAKLYPFGEREAAFLRILAGGRPSKLCARVGAVHGAEAATVAKRWIEALTSAGFCERLNIAHQLDDRDVQRFDRILHYFSEFETDQLSRYDYLARLRRCTVGVIGIGGLGSCLPYCDVHLRLALSGVPPPRF